MDMGQQLGGYCNSQARDGGGLAWLSGYGDAEK